jgi:hypothetical protein
MNPLLFATMANAEDHPTWDQVMNGPDARGYWEAAKKSEPGGIACMGGS